MIEVPHFGLHCDGELVFLHEGDGSLCLNPGLSTLTSPFKVTANPKLCPHRLIPSIDREIDTRRPLNNDLVHAMAPIPGANALFVPNLSVRHVEVVAMLDMVKSGQNFFDVWATTIRSLVPLLTVTNITPLVIIGLRINHLQDLTRFLALPRTRSVILLGAVKPYGAVEATGVWKAPKDDWAAEGLRQLRKYVGDRK